MRLGPERPWAMGTRMPGGVRRMESGDGEEGRVMREEETEGGEHRDEEETVLSNGEAPAPAQTQSSPAGKRGGLPTSVKLRADIHVFFYPPRI